MRIRFVLKGGEKMAREMQASTLFQFENAQRPYWFHCPHFALFHFAQRIY